MKKNRLVIALVAVVVTVLILALHKTPAAARRFEERSGNGATAPWEKTGGPPGYQNGANNPTGSPNPHASCHRPLQKLAARYKDTEQDRSRGRSDRVYQRV